MGGAQFGELEYRNDGIVWAIDWDSNKAINIWEQSICGGDWYYIYIYIYIYIHTYIHIFSKDSLTLCVYIYIYIYIHTHILSIISLGSITCDGQVNESTGRRSCG